MNTTKFSSKGQVIILKPKAPFPETNINDVASCLNYNDGTKTLDEMEQAIRKGIKAKYK